MVSLNFPHFQRWGRACHSCWTKQLLGTLVFLILSRGCWFWAKLPLWDGGKTGCKGFGVMTFHILGFFLPEARPHCAAQVGLESSILPWSPQCWEGMCCHAQLLAMVPSILIFLCEWVGDNMFLHCARLQRFVGHFLAVCL